MAKPTSHSMFRAVHRIVVPWLVVACSQPAAAPVAPHAPAPARGPMVKKLTIIGTNDLHGALERLPLLAGFVANVRAARAIEDGGVLLVDGGDLFQGTLESNLGEGVDVVRAYNQLGYAASAIGNHEFDYGPEGPAATAHEGEDPRGALRARIHEARFPFLASNVVDKATGQRIDWPNAPASRLVDVAGIEVGIVGASTEATPYTTMPANFKGLAIAPPAEAIASEARALRARGAQVIVAIAHIGSTCKSFEDPDDLSSCDRSEELFRVIDDLPKGLVDVFVAGHTHAGIAHRIAGIAVIESFSSGRGFGRVDLELVDGKVVRSTIARPQLMCPLDKDRNPAPVAACHPAPYEGRPVVSDPAVQTIVDQAVQRAGVRRAEKLGVTLAQTITKQYAVESPEGDLVTDLMLAAEPGADVALANGGGLRADLPAGELTYGQLFEAIPFDNRFALVKVTGAQLRELVAGNLAREGGIFSWGGLTAKVRCTRGPVDVEVSVRGKPLSDGTTYTIVTSDFLASGGDGALAKLKLPDGSITVTETIIRDAIADVLRKKKGTIEPPADRRLDYPGRRPVKCGAP